MFRNRVIMPTASEDRGTGEPIPMSCPVSRGSNLGLSLEPSVVPGTLESGNRSGLVSALNCKWEGASGAERSSLGTISMPPFPMFGP